MQNKYHLQWWGLAVLACLMLSACTTTPQDVFDPAETPEQKAFAANEVWLATLTNVQSIVQDPNVPSSFKDRLRSMVQKAAPVVKDMREAASRVSQARAAWLNAKDEVLLLSESSDDMDRAARVAAEWEVKLRVIEQELPGLTLAATELINDLRGASE